MLLLFGPKTNSAKVRNAQLQLERGYKGAPCKRPTQLSWRWAAENHESSGEKLISIWYCKSRKLQQILIYILVFQGPLLLCVTLGFLSSAPVGTFHLLCHRYNMGGIGCIEDIVGNCYFIFAFNIILVILVVNRCLQWSWLQCLGQLLGDLLLLALEPALLFRLPLLIIETFNSWLKLSAAGKNPLRCCQFVKSKSARQQLSPVVNAVGG